MRTLRRFLINTECPHLSAQQERARRHLERERAKKRGKIAEIQERRRAK